MREKDEVKIMKLEDMQELLCQEYEIVETTDIPHGHKIALQNGAIVNVYTKGTYNVQGKQKEIVKEYIEQNATDRQKSERGQRLIPKKVFVVYGHDETARDELELVLRRWGLEPVILD